MWLLRHWLPTSLVIMTGLMVSYCSLPSDPKPTVKAPDVQSVVRTSVLSLQKQAELTVLTAELNSVATSSYSSTGMTAQQTDISGRSVRYTVNLAAIKPSNVKLVGNVVSVTIPDVNVVIADQPYHSVTYNNGSWLFTVGDATKILSERNKLLIQADLVKQANTFQQTARASAQQSVASLFQMPLNAAGLSYSVEVHIN